MYISLGLTAAYKIYSYYYNYYNKYKANDYRQKTGASLAVMQGNLVSFLNGATPNEYKILLSERIKITSYSYNEWGDLSGYIVKFGVHNMQAALGAIIEGRGLEELPYIYIPYHQYIKPAIAMIGLGEFVYQQLDNIRIVYNYGSGSLGVPIIIHKYGIESISTLKAIRADFSEIDGRDIHNMILNHGLDSVGLLKEAGVDLSKMGRDYVLYIVKKLGKDSITLLKDGGAVFSSLYGFDIVDIAKGDGKDSLQLLKNADADFNMLGPGDIVQLIINHGLDVIPFLANIGGVDFDKMSINDIILVLDKYGKDAICSLDKVGVDFSVLDLNNVLSIIDNYGEEYIWLLQDVGVDFNQLSEGDIDMSNNLDTNINTIYSDSFFQSFEYIGLDNGVM